MRGLLVGRRDSAVALRLDIAVSDSRVCAYPCENNVNWIARPSSVGGVARVAAPPCGDAGIGLMVADLPTYAGADGS